jgi:hypothetical protein
VNGLQRRVVTGRDAPRWGSHGQSDVSASNPGSSLVNVSLRDQLLSNMLSNLEFDIRPGSGIGMFELGSILGLF